MALHIDGEKKLSEKTELEDFQLSEVKKKILNDEDLVKALGEEKEYKSSVTEAPKNKEEKTK